MFCEEACLPFQFFCISVMINVFQGVKKAKQENKKSQPEVSLTECQIAASEIFATAKTKHTHKKKKKKSSESYSAFIESSLSLQKRCE